MIAVFAGFAGFFIGMGAGALWWAFGMLFGFQGPTADQIGALGIVGAVLAQPAWIALFLCMDWIDRRLERKADRRAASSRDG
ncbi:MAG: hypothetical protein VW338_00955 [Rhodospirillaceae bacterium]